MTALLRIGLTGFRSPYTRGMGITQDFAVNPQLPTRLTLAIYRGGSAAQAKRSPLVKLWKVADLIWTRTIVGAELPFSFAAGPGLRLPHWGRGVIIAPGTRVGSGVTLYHRTTLGIGKEQQPPTLGDSVYVGTGAVILGPSVVGDGAVVGANSTIVRDVPAAATVVGSGRILNTAA